MKYLDLYHKFLRTKMVSFVFTHDAVGSFQAIVGLLYIFGEFLGEKRKKVRIHFNAYFTSYNAKM